MNEQRWDDNYLMKLSTYDLEHSYFQEQDQLSTVKCSFPSNAEIKRFNAEIKRQPEMTKCKMCSLCVEMMSMSVSVGPPPATALQGFPMLHYCTHHLSRSLTLSLTRAVT